MDIDTLGLGASRLVRYSYGGFLLALLAAILEPQRTKEVIDSLTPAFAVVATVIVGAGLYVLHRAMVVPLHHLALCGLFRLYEKIARPAKTASPTKYLNEEIGVSMGFRILGYSVLRRGDFFPNKQELDLAHAESGLLIMTSMGMFLASLYAFLNERAGRWYYFGAGLFFLAASFISAWIQHSAECVQMKKNPTRVKEKLSEFGIPTKK